MKSITLKVGGPLEVIFQEISFFSWSKQHVHQQKNPTCLEVRGVYQCLGRFLGTIDQNPRVSKVQLVTCFDILVFLYQFEVHSTHSSKMIDNFPKVSNFNQFICNQQSVLPIHWFYVLFWPTGQWAPPYTSRDFPSTQFSTQWVANPIKILDGDPFQVA